MLKHNTAAATFPGAPDTVAELDDLLSDPSAGAIETVAKLEGDYVVLGVGGKMGPTLARMIRRAVDAAGVRRRVIGVSRFTSGDLPNQLASQQIEPIACDLLDAAAVARLPAAQNVVFMAGFKFGATADPSRTWAMNTLVPAHVAQRYRDSRIVAFSTGNVYPLVSPQTGGCDEQCPPAPQGEYAMSCLGRERILDYFSRSLGIPTALLRLNYAVEMRYGVLVDLARHIALGHPIDLSIGHVNVIWQGDANAMTLQSFDHVTSPATLLNLTGPELLSVRWLAEQLAAAMNRPVSFTGEEGKVALLNDARRALSLMGPPRVNIHQLIEWTARWVGQDKPTLGKPTHFEATDGKY